MYTFSPMMVVNSRKHHCRVRTYTRAVLVLSTNLEIQTKHYPLVFRNRRGDEARIKETCLCLSLVVGGWRCGEVTMGLDLLLLPNYVGYESSQSSHFYISVDRDSVDLTH
ncbi:hypothetical protein Tco_1036766 [Tanacetum coccineum]